MAADIARILAEVVLQSKAAIASWKQFGDAGVAEFKRVQTGAAQATAAVNQSLAQMQARMKAVSASTKAFGNSVRGVGQGISVGLGLPLTLFAKQAIDSFKEAQESTANLESTFAGLGKTAKFSLEEMKNFASTTQENLAVSDEAVLDMQSTLLKFGNIAPKQFNKARDAIIDYAQVSGQDLPAAAQQFGKALNDPLRGLRTLREAGIAFTDEQMKQIKAWQESGQTVKVQTLILDTFAQKYGQAAEKFAETDTGKQVIAMNQLGDSMERIGEMLIPFQLKLTQVIASILEAFTSLPEGVQEFIVWIGVLAIALGPVLVALGGLISVVGGVVGALATLAPLFAPLGGLFFTLGTVIGYVINIISVVGTAIAGVGLWPIIVAAALGALVVAVVMNWDKIVAVVKAAIALIANVFKEAWVGLQFVMATAVEGFKALWSGLVDWLKGLWDGFTGWFKEALDSMIGWLSGLVEKAKAAWEWLKKVISKKNEAKAGAGGGEAAEERARGGMIRGRGGRDTIPAWLTAGEYVQRVAAVRKYGVGFMNSINNLSFPMSRARGFAMGGMVSSPRMAFAGAGNRDAGGRSFTLVIDGQSFGGLRAPADTAAEMQAFAQSRRVRSAGRKPSWYG